jgi:hypothetical protein
MVAPRLIFTLGFTYAAVHGDDPANLAEGDCNDFDG